MSFVVIPTFDAVDAEAPRTEWAPNMDVSIPADSRNDFSHLAMVLEVTALCGLMMAMNNLSSDPLSVLVFSS